MNKEQLLLIGGGGHCKACIDVIEQEGRFDIAGILDLPAKVGQHVLGYPVIGTDADLPGLSKSYSAFFITLGQIKTPQRRMDITNILKTFDAALPTIVSPLAYVSKHAKIGEGTIIMHHAIVNAGATIGRNCIINTKALIEHDAHIGNHCHMSTGAIINGGVSVGEGTFVGSGAVIKENIIIESYSFIKATSIVKK
jgi:sugar O-acyltransferase (sialic acid O-acetyltransferase NeuD family)